MFYPVPERYFPHHPAFFWETNPVSLDGPFEYVTTQSRELSQIKPDRKTFSEHHKKGGLVGCNSLVSFPEVFSQSLHPNRKFYRGAPLEQIS